MTSKISLRGSKECQTSTVIQHYWILKIIQFGERGRQGDIKRKKTKRIICCHLWSYQKTVKIIRYYELCSLAREVISFPEGRQGDNKGKKTKRIICLCHPWKSYQEKTVQNYVKLPRDESSKLCTVTKRGVSTIMWRSYREDGPKLCGLKISSNKVNKKHKHRKADYFLHLATPEIKRKHTPKYTKLKQLN